MDYLQKIFTDFELHAADGIRECFKNGVDPDTVVNGKPLIYGLVNMYSRGPLFKRCIQVFIDFDVQVEDKVLLAVLSDNADLLDTLLTADKRALTKRYSFDCVFTPLYEVSLLHICAEYNHLACANVLLRHGADINEKAGLDEHGFGGQTPVFHTVNQDANKSIDMLKWLLALNADLSVEVKGLTWGKGYDWETFIPGVNPLSYAMMGLLRQFQRTEKQIYEIVSLLLIARYGIDYSPANVPNRYLHS
ncbi:ankyrin repeat domain-containing protein [Panacibacter sp. DH6]|uniref:Ankyrin repeat domain-containing protein n=1 Tax=Panacibacter microcysteis TaxID=2793269 RepID=A0A931GVD1_9BACT|nr:ankyrin repeat domain-containing protein [Panacibacter microcysteis]MBG9377681.1 ankyrin repeat domain-containing protein [Panacibacter microcysteis]